MERRAFLKACGLTASVLWLEALTRSQAQASGFYRAYHRAVLSGPDGLPLQASRLTPNENYLFFYPYVSTPCFLLDLGVPLPGGEVPVRGADGERYAWPGGVGAGRSVVAFTAICPHAWVHPQREFSPIAYHAPGQRSIVASGRDRLIVCCAHGSAFDPAAGGRVEQGPAELPLAFVGLEWDSGKDQLAARGILGPDSFDRFFQAFSDRSREEVRGATTVRPLNGYSETVARC